MLKEVSMSKRSRVGRHKKGKTGQTKKEDEEKKMVEEKEEDLEVRDTDVK